MSYSRPGRQRDKPKARKETARSRKIAHRPKCLQLYAYIHISNSQGSRTLMVILLLIVRSRIRTMTSIRGEKAAELGAEDGSAILG